MNTHRTTRFPFPSLAVGRRTWLLPCLCGIALLFPAVAPAADLPPPITAQSAVRVWPDQIGYRTDA